CPPDHVGVGREHGKNCDSPGKAPLHSWKELQNPERRMTADEIDAGFREHPNANIGIVLGEGSGVVRIDSDGPGGEALLAEWSKGDLPKTLEFTSGRENCGRGLLYKIPDGVQVRTTTQPKGENEELRLQANGAQTVLPPSRHKSGSRYVWK